MAWSGTQLHILDSTPKPYKTGTWNKNNNTAMLQICREQELNIVILLYALKKFASLLNLIIIDVP